MRLSLFGGNPELDYEALTQGAGGRRINKAKPERSLLLASVSGAAPHPAERRLLRDSPEYRTILAWIAAGTPYTNRNEPHLLSLRLFSPRQILRQGESCQLVLTAVFSDGLERDVTAQATYSSSEPAVARVETDGQVRAGGYGETVILTRYLRKSSTLRVLVPQPLPFAFPAVVAHNRIDELVHAKLSTLGFPPSELCTDQEFLRRAHLDTIGLLPTPAEVRQFLMDLDAGKRRKLVDRLLEREEFADFRALHWGELLRVKSDPSGRVAPKATQAYDRWLRTSLVENKPYDEFVRELLTASGSSFWEGPANFLRAVPRRDPRSMAESAVLAFMGARLECARCHVHPTENWGEEDVLSLAAFFGRVGFKPTSEWKEEVLYLNPKGEVRHPRTQQVVRPAWLGGQGLGIRPEEDPRRRLAAWLVSPENPWFARNLANRVWFWLLGRGLVHEPDDLRPTNPPSNPDLLDCLAAELVKHQFDQKHLYRLILNSRTYQTSSRPNDWNIRDTAHFSRYPVKRLGAEQLLDVISQVTETSDTFTNQVAAPSARLPTGHRAAQVSDGSTGSPFLETVGRPPRDFSHEDERATEPSLGQALCLLNSDQFESKINASPRLRRLLDGGRSDSEILEEVYLAALSRGPTSEEKGKALEYLARRKTARAQALADVLWAVLNTTEFLCVR